MTDELADPADAAHLMPEVRESWRARRLGAGEDSFLAALSVLRLQRVMTQALDSVLRPLQLNITDYLLLTALQLDADGTRLISQLARALVVHTTTVTLAVERLETRELLIRAPHPTDRRATVVRLTGEGHALAHRATAALTDMDFGLSGSSKDDRAALIEVVTRVRDAAGDPTPQVSG